MLFDFVSELVAHPYLPVSDIAGIAGNLCKLLMLPLNRVSSRLKRSVRYGGW